ncbi:MAG: primosomal protein N' family DNA-binding protein, partial [Thermoanaerobaculia bacterium]
MTQGLASYAEIAVPVAVHGTFTYTIPDPLRDSVRLGSRVEVEIGSKLTTGFVVGFNDTTETTKLKPVRSVLDEDEPPLLPEIIQLCKWAAEYYIAPLGEMLRVALPANMGARGKREATLVGSDEIIAAARESKQVLDSDLEIISELRKRPLLLREMN